MRTPKRSCEDCYFRKNLLCALELDEPCPTFRSNRPEGVALSQRPAVPEVTLTEASEQSSGESKRQEYAEPREGAIAKACWLLPRDIREDQRAEWVDEIQCAREHERAVVPRLLSLVVLGIPRLRLRRLRKGLTRRSTR